MFPNLDIKGLFIFILTLLCVGIYGWGYVGWIKYDKAQKDVTQLSADKVQLESSLIAIKETADKELKKKTDSEKEYRTAYLFEKNQIDNMQDPDESLGCEESTQKAIADVLKIKDIQ